MAQAMADDIGELLLRQISEGNYRNFEDAVAALKDVATDDALLSRLRSTWLQQEIAKGDASGGEIPAEEVFSDLRAIIDGGR